MEEFRENYRNQLMNLSEQMRSEPMPQLTEELFALFETTGNRLCYENVYFNRRKFLAVYGIAAYLLKRHEDIVKLEEVLWEICAEECWALPAHVNRRENAEWYFTVDLFAAETAQALAEILMLMKEQQGKGLSKEICKRVKEEIERRVLVPFEKSRQGWECSDHNWNAVCGGSIGSAAIYLLAEKEKERLGAILKRICHSLTFYLAGFREDGACMEGIGYFTYGMTYFTGFAEQLYRYSGGNINLFANEKVRKIAEFQQKMYFMGGQTVSFSDGDKQAKFRMGLTCFLARQYDTVQIPDRKFACDFETDPCYRFMGLLRDMMWTQELGKEGAGSWAGECRRGKAHSEKSSDTIAKKNTERSMSRQDIFPSAQWSICESENGVGFAIKGGDNGEPHNHNDIGSFLYLAAGEQFICDLGAGEYTGAYFGSERYEILCNSSEGHSVPIVNGDFQKEGKSYRTSVFEADGKGRTKLEFAGAYGEDGVLHTLIRRTDFSMENGSLMVTDCFNVQKNRLKGNRVKCLEASGICAAREPFVIITEQLVTQGEVELINGQEQFVIIRGKNASCCIKILENAENLRVVEKVHSNHEGEEEIVRLIRWDLSEQLPKDGEMESLVLQSRFEMKILR